MKKMIYLYISILVMLVCTSCDRHEAQNVEDNESEVHTLAIYMCGSSLETDFGAATDAIRDMEQADLPDNVNVCIMLGGAYDWKYDGLSRARNYYATIENHKLLIKDNHSSEDMGNPKTYMDYMDWVIENYPADRYATIFWDHGSGSYGNICFDENYMNYLDLAELEKCLIYFKERIGGKIDFAGFDACMMANYEVASMLSEYAEYLIASEDKEPEFGWDYKTLISNIGKDDFYDKVLDSYEERCKGYNRKLYTLSAIKLDMIDELDGSLQEMYRNIAGWSAKNVTDAAVAAINFGTNNKKSFSNQLDLGCFADELEIKGIREILTKMIKCRNGELYCKASGLSIFFPLCSRTDLDSYKQIYKSNDYIKALEYYIEKAKTTTVLFTNNGIEHENKLNASITNDSYDNLVRVDYALYEVDENDYNIELQYLGDSPDVIVEKDKSFSADFDGKWISINDMALFCRLVNEERDYDKYSVIAEINGVLSDIYIIFDREKGTYIVEGYIPKEKEDIQERIIQLQKDDDIRLYTLKPNTESYDMVSVGDSFRYANGLIIGRSYLPDGYYSVYIEFVDMQLKVCYSKSAVYKVETGQCHLMKIIPGDNYE